MLFHILDHTILITALHFFLYILNFYNSSFLTFNVSNFVFYISDDCLIFWLKYVRFHCKYIQIKVYRYAFVSTVTEVK